MLPSESKPSSCPSCGTLIECATLPDELFDEDTLTKPSPGDYSICMKCDAMLMFNDDMSPRLATEEEVALFVKNNPVGYADIKSTTAFLRKLTTPTS